MYLDEIGFDTMPLATPLGLETRPGPADALEQEFADRFVGLILASDLFAARNPGPRSWLDEVPLATCWEGATIRFCGERLDQDDLDALLGCMLTAYRQSGRTGAARFRLRELTRLIRPKGRRFDARRLERSLWRLASARVEIEEEAGSVRMQAKLVHTLLCDRPAGCCAMDINPRLLAGFHGAPTVERLLSVRAPLGAAPFPRWLAGLLAHGPACVRLDLAVLRRLSGLSRQPLPAFRQRTIAALQDFLDLGYVEAIEPAGPDRLVVKRPVARGEEPACLLLS